MGTLIRPSLPSGRAAMVASMSAIRAVLRRVDELPEAASGALEYDDGCILVENRRVCWAACTRARRRLTDILMQRASPPVEQSRIEQVVKSCRGGTLPIGEALVQSGLVTEEQLGASLRQHITESICLLAASNTIRERWVPRTRPRYDARFTFSTIELSCSAGALRAPDLALRATAELRDVLAAEARGVAFVRDPGSASPLMLAEVRCDVFSTDSVLSLCEWTLGIFDVSASITPDLKMAIGTWRAGAVVTAWQVADTTHVALCEGPAFAMLATRLSDTRLQAAARAPEPGEL